MAIKALFLDIDGTLVPFDAPDMRPSTKAALEEAHRRGVASFIVTGRYKDSIGMDASFDCDGYATANGAELYIGHVIDSTVLETAGAFPSDLIPGMDKAFRESIEPLVAEAKANDRIPKVEIQVKTGRIRETLKEELLDVIKPDLVLCGARGLSSIKYALLGSISTFLLRNTDCDILVVK